MDDVLEAIRETTIQVERACPSGFVYFKRACGTYQGSPILCGDLLCPDCQKRWAAEARERWAPVIEQWVAPRMLTLTLTNSPDLAERVAFERASFRRLLDTRLGSRNWPKFAAEAFDVFRERLEASGNEVNEKFLASQERLMTRLARVVRTYHASHGKWPRVRDLFKAGLSNIETTDTESGEWHVHRHVIYDGAIVPVVLWSYLWWRATKGDSFIVDVCHMTPEEAAREGIKYVLKPAELSTERAAEFREVFKNCKKIWRLGDVSPAEPEPKPCPFCGELDCQVEPWTVQLSISHKLSADGKQVELQLESGVVVLRKVEGVWREWWSLGEPLYLIHEELTCHSRARDGPDVASNGFDTTLLDALHGSEGLN